MSNIKQSPFLGLTGMGGGGTGLAHGGAVAKKTYLDDIFSTYLTRGNATARSINTGIDMTKGGLVWSKSRSGNHSHFLFDTERGANTFLRADSANANYTESTSLTSFNSNGFSLGTWAGVNENSGTNVHFSFRKQKGFFTLKEYSGSNSAQTLSHDLGCVPGLILIKRTDSSSAWMVYHTSLGSGQYAKLNTTVAFASGSVWDSTSPTSTTFTVEGNNSDVNTSGGTFIAYLFAGGESTASDAVSVEFDGAGNEALTIPHSTDFDISTGDYTFECWVRPDDSDDGGGAIMSTGNDGTASTYEACLFLLQDLSLDWYIANSSSSWIHTSTVAQLENGQWSHIAATREGNTFRFFFNGTLAKEFTNSATLNNVNQPFHIGGRNGAGAFNGKISNFRFVKGTAVYTTSFIPSYKPLTNISNTKLLCCNNSSVTGSTVTPDTITSQGNAAASTDSPFDDPASFKFGEGGKQQIVKTGSHNHKTTDPVRIYTGWEPQWVMFKNATQASNWAMYDVMRGIFIGSDGPSLAADSNTAENGVVGQGQIVIPHGDGFTIRYGLTAANPGNGDKIIYVAIRRSDGYTASTPEAGTEVFGIDTGNASSTIPTFDSGFPVDFTFVRPINISTNWGTYSRLTGEKFLRLNTQDAQGNYAGGKWDDNTGFGAESYWDSNSVAWMWKRGLGMDTVAFTGDGVQGRDIAHSLGVAPNMMWLKNRTRTAGGGSDWIAYVSGITHLSVYGSDPDNYGNNPVAFELNNTEKAQFSGSGYWDHTHPTSTHFRVGDTYHCNQSGEDIIAYLFASIDGISKVGSYSGSNSDQTITLGFQPRFFLCKCSNTQGTGFSWNVFDSVRGISGSSTKRLWLDLQSAEQSGSYVTSVSSTGITLAGDYSHSNQASRNYIYYAHA